MNIDDKDDFWENSEIPEKEPEPKKPQLKPEDPGYWEEPESEWEHLNGGTNWRLWGWIGVSVVLICTLTALWFHYFSPAVDMATQYGYVENIDRHKKVFKTYEGVILPYKEIHDTTRVYREDFVFSAADVNIATKLKTMQNSGRPVKVDYVIYRAVVPWRGESKVVVVNVDSVDPAIILPPEFRPAFLENADK